MSARRGKDRVGSINTKAIEDQVASLVPLVIVVAGARLQRCVAYVDALEAVATGKPGGTTARPGGEGGAVVTGTGSKQRLKSFNSQARARAGNRWP